VLRGDDQRVLSLSLLALGRPSLTGVIVERMYDEQPRLFRPLAGPRPAREPTVTWAALAPLALPDLPEAIGRRLVEEHLLDPERFWLPVPPPSVPATDPSFLAPGVDSWDQTLLARGHLDQRGLASLVVTAAPRLCRSR